MPTPKFYVVWYGRKPGIYHSWEDCKEQIHGFENAVYKSFKTQALAEAAFKQDPSQHIQKNHKQQKPVVDYRNIPNGPILNSISVDAACSGNPGVLEYQGVFTETQTPFFKVSSIPLGTNNLGEFLAIVHALALLKKEKSRIPIYSDSETAIAWIRRKKVKSNLIRSAETQRVWELVDRAQAWLDQHTVDNQILKWQTELWGEIPADFGRK